MTAELRAATPDDLDAIDAIERAVFGSDAWSRAQLREELSAAHRSYVVLAEPGAAGAPGRLLGYAGLFQPGREADVQTIAVSEDARGAGHGRALMRALIERASAGGGRELFLEVRADNPVARQLYASLGFAELGVRPNYYQPDGVDAVVMRLDLAASPGGTQTND